jgi:3-hydroxy acid dehydrogenase/malonic semialdehyde reductase
MGKDYVFISGASSGIGKACAELFGKKGFNLILTGRRKEHLITLKESLMRLGIDVILLNFDVRNFEHTESAIQSLPNEVKKNLSILINNAGLAVGRDAIQNGVLEDWNRMIDTNIKGLLHVSKCIIPIFESNQKGHIFNLSSIAGKEVYPAGNVYCASKHAVDALSKAMRIDLLPLGIKVTNIAPGAVETEFSLVRFKGNENVANSVYDGFEPLRPEDIAETIFFAANLPAHVNLNDITIMPTAQANGSTIHKK